MKILADEMEREINYRSMRIAFLFSELAFLIYYIYELISANSISFSVVIWLIQNAIFFCSKMLYHKHMMKDDK
jgi:fatty acid desaturase